MKKNKLLLLLIAVLVAVVAMAIIYFLPKLEFKEPPRMSKTEITPPEASGSIDTVEDALIKELLDEDLLLVEEDGDALLIISDDNEIDDFGQAVNEKDI